MDGTLTQERGKRGYFIVTSDYLMQCLERGGGWDFTIPKKVLDLKEFAALRKTGN
jgi:hypothetical protein